MPIDYQKTLRFKNPTRDEVLHPFIEKIAKILTYSENEHPSFFNQSGPRSGLFGLKLYPDPFITKVQNLFKNLTFLAMKPQEKYLKILEEIVDFETPLQSSTSKTNQNVIDFILAIRSEDNKKLDELINYFKKKRSHSLNKSVQVQENVNLLLSKPSRELVVFKKEQAATAAKWWLDVLKSDSDFATKISLSDEQEITQLTKRQANIFFAELSDAIWERCKTTSVNLNRIAINIDINQNFILQNAAKEAGIELILSLHSHLYFTHLYPNGDVTVQKGEELKLYDKSKQTLLPSDEIIQLRNRVSTFIGGHVIESNTGIDRLPKDMFRQILLFSAPNVPEAKLDLEVEEINQRCSEYNYRKKS